MPRRQEPRFIQQMRQRAERSEPTEVRRGHTGDVPTVRDVSDMSDSELNAEIRRLSEEVHAAYKQERRALVLSRAGVSSPTNPRPARRKQSLSQALRARGIQPNRSTRHWR
jgi:hypothetical protein